MHLIPRVNISGVLSETICTFDYNNQFPTAPIAPKDFMGTVRDAFHVRLQQSIPHIIECIYKLQGSCHRCFAHSTTTTNSPMGVVGDALHV